MCPVTCASVLRQIGWAYECLTTDMYTKDQNDRVVEGMQNGCALPLAKRCDTAFYKLVCPETCGAALSTTTTAATTTITTTTSTATTLAATSETSTSGATTTITPTSTVKTRCLFHDAENVVTWDGVNYRWIVNDDDTGTAIGVNTGTYRFKVTENGLIDGLAVAFGPLASDGEKSVQYFELFQMWNDPNEDRTFYSVTFAASFESFEGSRTIDDYNKDTESYDEVAPRAVLRFDTQCDKGYTTTATTTTTTSLRECTDEEISTNDSFSNGGNAGCDPTLCEFFVASCPIICGTCARPP